MRRPCRAVVVTSPQAELASLCRALRRVAGGAKLLAVSSVASEPEVRALVGGELDDYFIYPPTREDLAAIRRAAGAEEDDNGKDIYHRGHRGHREHRAENSNSEETTREKNTESNNKSRSEDTAGTRTGKLPVPRPEAAPVTEGTYVSDAPAAEMLVETGAPAPVAEGLRAQEVARLVSAATSIAEVERAAAELVAARLGTKARWIDAPPGESARAVADEPGRRSGRW